LHLDTVTPLTQIQGPWGDSGYRHIAEVSPRLTRTSPEFAKYRMARENLRERSYARCHIFNYWTL